MRVNRFGEFSGNPRTEWLVDADGADRDMRLLEDFWYRDPDGRRWSAPAGSIVNGASIPRPLWATVGSPFTDNYRRASIVHDVACHDPAVSRREADAMFYHACRAGGCSARQARLLYAGVRLGSWARIAAQAPELTARRLLFRVPFRAVAAETLLLQTFRTVAAAIEALDEAATPADLEAEIDRQLDSLTASPSPV